MKKGIELGLLRSHKVEIIEFLNSDYIRRYTGIKNIDRNRDIIIAYCNGESIVDIANEFDICNSLVDGILHRYWNYYIKSSTISMSCDLYKINNNLILKPLRRVNIETISQLKDYIKSGKDLKDIRGIGVGAESSILNYFDRFDREFIAEYKSKFCS